MYYFSFSIPSFSRSAPHPRHLQIVLRASRGTRQDLFQMRACARQAWRGRGAVARASSIRLFGELPASSSSPSPPSAARQPLAPSPPAPLLRPPPPSRLHRLAPVVVRGRRLNPGDLYGSRSSKTAGKKRVKKWQEACEAFLKLSAKEAGSVLSAFPFPPGAEDAAARAKALPRSNQARKREVGLLAKFLSDDDEIDPEGSKGAEAFAAAVSAAGSGRPVGAAATAAGTAAELWRDLLLGDVDEDEGDGGDNEGDAGAASSDPVAAADRAALEKLVFGLAASAGRGRGGGDDLGGAEEREQELEEGEQRNDNSSALLLPDAQQLRQMIRAARAERKAALLAAKAREAEAAAVALAAAEEGEASGGGATTMTLVASKKRAAGGATKAVAGKKLLRALRAFAEVHFRGAQDDDDDDEGGEAESGEEDEQDSDDDE